ncbi:MAG: phospholipase D family protein [Verrucomicrobia bacterium]|nr:MAG: phospholipase D family protein [Verrucomicrobiota bacterium]
MFKLPITTFFAFAIAVVPVFSRDQSNNAQTLPSSSISERKIDVYFSPNGGGEQAIVKELSQAKKSVLVLAYSFTSAPIAQALGQAKDRGLDVQVILDKSQKRARYSVINYLQSHGISVFIDIPHAIAHNKVMIIDGQDVITGSYNFTSSAEKRNAENLLIIRNDSQIATVYTREWHHLNNQSALATPTASLRQ